MNLAFDLAAMLGPGAREIVGRLQGQPEAGAIWFGDSVKRRRCIALCVLPTVAANTEAGVVRPVTMILVFGSINLDLIFPLPALPAPGETLLAPSVRIEPGGKGANQAVAAARDGAQVAMVGAVGCDALAGAALATLRDSGVDLSGTVTVDAATGCAGIFVDREGRNVIGVGSGANLAVRAAQVPDPMPASATTILLQMEVPAAETGALIHRARRGNRCVVLNLAPAGTLDPRALEAVDVLVVNESEAAWLAGTLGTAADAIALRTALGGTVVRTLGAAGVEAAAAEGQFRLPADRVAVVDTTGAGDCFTGVLAAALDRAMPLPAALRRAVAAAGVCCSRAGSQQTMPTAAEIDAALGGRLPV
ncbi:MAG: ribokinase [Acetobacteraceae bacterium]